MTNQPLPTARHGHDVRCISTIVVAPNAQLPRRVDR